VKVDFGIWSKLTQTIVALVALAALLFIFALYLPLIHQNEQYRRRIDKLQGELDKEKAGSKRLQTEFDALRNDPKTIERLARAQLRYAKTNETVFYFEPPATNTVPH